MANIRTYKNCQDEVLNWLDEAGDTDTTLALAKQGIVAAHEQRLTQERWPFMIWEPTETINLIPGTQVYSLHPEFLRPIQFRNRTTQDDLVEIFDHNLLLQGDWSSTAVWDSKFTMFGKSPVANQPTSASVLSVSSSNGGDAAAQISVRGDTADGVTTEVIQAGVAGSVSFTRILNVTKIGIWLGTMTLTSNGGAVTNLKLFASEYGRSHQRIQLIGSPSSAVPVDYRFYRQPSPLNLDNDIPDIPPPFTELLVWDTLLDFSAYNEFDRGIVQLWASNQQDLLHAMQASLNSPQTLGASSQYVNYIPR